jgi:hypothetical protein
MTDRQEKRGELPRDRLDEAAKPDPPPQPNRNTRDDGRGRDAGRTGSESNAS